MHSLLYLLDFITLVLINFFWGMSGRNLPIAIFFMLLLLWMMLSSVINNSFERRIISTMWGMADSLGMTAEDIAHLTTIDQEMLEATRDRKFKFRLKNCIKFSQLNIYKTIQMLEELTEADRDRLVRLRGV